MLDEDADECNTPDDPNNDKSLNAYYNIPRKIRVAIQKKKFCYDALKSLKVNVTCLVYSRAPFFHYYHMPGNCHERLLVHAVARYHGLQSESK